MKLKDLCEQVNIPYNSKNPTRSLNTIKKEYLIEQNGNKKDYTIIRPLTEQEKTELQKISDCKKILKDTIYVSLSLVKENKIRSDIKGFLELFNMVNGNYKYFTYDTMTEQKYDLLKDYTDPKLENSVLHDFVGDVHPILNRLVKETFNDMVDERLIYKKEILMFGYYERYQLEDGYYVETRRKVEANDEQIKEFLEHSRKYMSEKGYNKWSEVPYFTKIDINRKICRDMGISYVYTDYEIILNNDGISNEVEHNKDLKELKDSLNKSTIKKLLRSTQGKLKELTLDEKKDRTDMLIKRRGEDE